MFGRLNNLAVAENLVLFRCHCCMNALLLCSTVMRQGILILFVLLQGVSCLRLIALDVPESIFVGQVARLSCLFDEEHDDLYSVKWYKDDVEFFRFLPNDRPANQFFSIGDVDVDMSRSSNGTVFLRNTNRSAEGQYRCEISADAPSFQSISSEKYMAVEDRPISMMNAAQYFTSNNFYLSLTILVVLILSSSKW